MGRLDHLPVIRLTPGEFMALPEYSASLPTGTRPGKRWRRFDGAHDPRTIAAGIKPMWMIGEYDPKCPDEAKTIRVFWYRPIISITPKAEQA